MSGTAERQHIPVMLSESIEMLNLTPGKTYVDATVGAGGHLREIAQRCQNSGTVYGIDQDSISLQRLQAELTQEGLASRIKLIHSNFRDIETALRSNGIDTIDGGVLADLGVSSMQLDNAERGFSFMNDGPLDMRMNPEAPTTAEGLINSLPENELADIIYKFGEERLSRQIAHRIVEARPLHTTGELAAVVSPVVRRQRRGKRDRDESHPATRTFQAIRMAVNDELGAIEEFIRSTISILKPGARIVVITFHSLEDRLVKQIFREAALSCVCPPKFPICNCDKKQDLKVLTSKPLLPDPKETLANPRSRSAKLRAGEKV